jgi:hypothetical protein
MRNALGDQTQGVTSQTIVSGERQMNKTDLTAARLQELLHYNPDTGIFTWRVARNQKAIVGSEAGHKEAKGYRSICIDGKDFKAHRLAWLYVHGRWPKAQIDHRNRVKDANWILNLREATNAENQMNTKTRSDNTSGIRGVYFDKNAGKWRAQAVIAGKRKALGSFDTAEHAAAARKLATQLDL